MHTVHLQPITAFVYHGRRPNATGHEIGVSLQLDPPDDFPCPVALVIWSLN